MTAYDKTELENTLLADEAETLKKAGFISNEQLHTVKKIATLKEHKNLLVRFGFFLLGSFLYSSISGVLSLFFVNDFQNNYEILLYVYAIIGLFGLELLCKLKFYGYGLDDAFLLGFQLMFLVAIGISTKGSELTIAILVSIISAATFIRYIQLSSAVIFCLGTTAIIAYTAFEVGDLGKNLLPFLMMIFSAVFYFISKRVLAELKPVYYYNGIKFINNYCLILFYLSGNYMIVRELSVILLKKEILANQDISFASFFYIFTFVIPIAYILYALKKRKRIMLWIGLICFIFSIYTVWYYYQIITTEILLTLGGLILFAFTYFSIKKTKENETGITFKPDRFADSKAFENAEIIIAAAQTGTQQTQPIDDSKIKFGGGDFSGGGSSESY